MIAALVLTAAACFGTALYCLIARKRTDWALLFILGGLAYLAMARLG